MIQNSAQDFRINYDIAVATVAKANGTTKEGVNLQEITQGYLWTEATIKPNQQVIQWPIIDTQSVANAPITPTMQLLTMQDSFMVTALSYFLMTYSMTGSDQQNINFATGNNWDPITYPSPWDNNGSAVNWDPGNAIFWIGSYISIEVNKKVLIPKWDCYRHYKAPAHQAVTGQFTPNWITKQKNEHDGSTDGFYPVEPNIIIGGGRDNIIKLNLASNIPAGIAPFNLAGYGETFIAKAVLCFRGILMQNSTAVK